jgi:hypothetical protein
MSESPITITIQQTERGWDVGQSNGVGSVWPTTCYPNAAKAAARVLQLMEISRPVEPQSWPERIVLGEIDE